MALTTINAQSLPPGSYVFEDVKGRLPAQISDFSRAYIFLEGSSGNYASPLQIVSAEDAETQFGIAGVGLASIENLFLHNRRAVLFGIRVPIGQVHQVGVAGAGDDSYSVTVDGVQASYTSSGSEDADDIIDGLMAAINDTQSGVASLVIATNPDYDNDTFELRSLDPATTAETPLVITASTGGTGSVTDTDLTPSDPSPQDWVWAIQNSFDPDLHRPGFLLAPEAFNNMSEASDRLSVGTALTDFAETNDYLAVIDPGSGFSSVADYQADGLQYSSSRGHAAYYCPYVTNLNDMDLPPSSYAVGTALRRYEVEGFHQPPAGGSYQLRNVKGTSVHIPEAQHSTLNNDHNINVIKQMFSAGFQIRGARTRTDSALFNTVTDRVIFNVLLESLRRTLNRFVFESIDGDLELFRAIRRTVNSILHRLWSGGVLFGQDPSKAFEVICDRSNNPPADLEAGRVNVTIFAVPSPFVEKLVSTANRVAIGEVQFYRR